MQKKQMKDAILKKPHNGEYSAFIYEVYTECWWHATERTDQSLAAGHSSEADTKALPSLLSPISEASQKEKWLPDLSFPGGTGVGQVSVVCGSNDFPVER